MLFIFYFSPQVVIDAFRLINPNMMVLGQEPRQTTSNLGHLHKPSIQVSSLDILHIKLAHIVMGFYTCTFVFVLHYLKFFSENAQCEQFLSIDYIINLLLQ